MLRLLSRAMLVLIVAMAASVSARAQNGFDRPGGDYTRFVVPSGDPAACAARCDREGRCRAWAFAYPGTGGGTTAMCWLKSTVPAAVENQCCVSGIKGAGLVEKKSGPVEMSIDRYGGDFRSVDLPPDPSGAACQKMCEDDNRCRAWTYVRPGYLNHTSSRCYLKDKITQPRRKPCCMSGVVR